jgi:hypothetical protein
MTAVAGSGNLGPNLRIDDKRYSQRYMIDQGPKIFHLIATDLAYAPGSSGLSRST